MRRRIAVCGSPALAAKAFAVLAAEHEVVLVISQPDKPAGRNHALTPTPVSAWALEQGIELWRPHRLTDQDALRLQHLGIEVVVVIAFGQLLRPAFLDTAPPCWNLHFSLLPAYRGAAPVQHAILNGDDACTGVSVFQIQEGLDDGPVLWQQSTDISGMSTVDAWDVMAAVGTEGLAMLLSSDDFPPSMSEQVGAVTLAPLLKKSDGLLDPSLHTAEQAMRMLRAYTPWPGVAYDTGDIRLRVVDAQVCDEHDVAAGVVVLYDHRVFLGLMDSTLELLHVQMPAGRIIPAQQWYRNHHQAHTSLDG